MGSRQDFPLANRSLGQGGRHRPAQGLRPKLLARPWGYCGPSLTALPVGVGSARATECSLPPSTLGSPLGSSCACSEFRKLLEVFFFEPLGTGAGKLTYLVNLTWEHAVCQALF